MSHPPRPVFGFYAACLRPFVGRVELGVPFERPELFEPDLSYRPIQEKAVYVLVVPVDAKWCHAEAVMTGESWRTNEEIIRPTRRSHRIEKNRNPVHISNGEDFRVGQTVTISNRYGIIKSVMNVEQPVV